MQNATWSLDVSKQIRKAKGGANDADVICPHCGALTARLEAPEMCGTMYAKEEQKEPDPKVEANEQAAGEMNPSYLKDLHYKRKAPESLPQANYGQNIICTSCGNIAAVLRPVRNNMYI